MREKAQQRLLDNRSALVTGGSRGIGRAVALRLADMGALVYVNYLSNREAAEETVAIIAEEGGWALAVPFDVSDGAAVEATVKKLTGNGKAIDILVNNAGITLNALFLRTSGDDWDRLMATNLKGTFHCCRAVVRGMVRQRWGRIVNMVSVVAEGGNAGQVCYGASKAGILGLTTSLAREVGSRNITVNAVAPGFVETDMTSSLDTGARERIMEQVPLGRLGRPEDVAGVVGFLLTPDADYMTGQVLRVNGGLYM